jgi:hypothetical protein
VPVIPCEQWLTVRGQVLGRGLVIVVFSSVIVSFVSCHLPCVSVSASPSIPVAAAAVVSAASLAVSAFSADCRSLPLVSFPPSGVIPLWLRSPPSHPWVWPCRSRALGVVPAGVPIVAGFWAT